MDYNCSTGISSYEAYVIYNFLVLLINAGGGERQLTYLLVSFVYVKGHTSDSYC